VKVEKHFSQAAHTSSNPEPGAPSHVAQPRASQEVEAFNGDDNEKALLEQAINSFINNGHVKLFPVTPDSSIGQLMAVNRVGDIAVESEYSLRVGQSGKKITSVTPSATGLVITTQGDLILGGGSSLGFYWEDVQTIYCIELDTPSGKVYYFVLNATNLNQSLVVQCNTPNNLNHLVSAFEYFIKAAQGKYVPVTGMPYLNQGMVLGDQGKVTALWANSPAADAGLTFADHVWSVQGNQEQKGADLESALNSLPSGKQTINVVAPADWQAAEMKESKAKNGQFNPKLTKFGLVVR